MRKQRKTGIKWFVAGRKRGEKEAARGGKKLKQWKNVGVF